MDHSLHPEGCGFFEDRLLMEEPPMKELLMTRMS